MCVVVPVFVGVVVVMVGFVVLVMVVASASVWASSSCVVSWAFTFARWLSGIVVLVVGPLVVSWGCVLFSVVGCGVFIPLVADGGHCLSVDVRSGGGCCDDGTPDGGCWYGGWIREEDVWCESGKGV